MVSHDNLGLHVALLLKGQHALLGGLEDLLDDLEVFSKNFEIAFLVKKLKKAY